MSTGESNLTCAQFTNLRGTWFVGKTFFFFIIVIISGWAPPPPRLQYN